MVRLFLPAAKYMLNNRYYLLKLVGNSTTSSICVVSCNNVRKASTETEIENTHTALVKEMVPSTIGAM